MSDWSIYAALGDAVSTRRKKLGLTQADVAKKVGLSRASVANIECGRQKVLLHHVYLLAQALNLPSIMSLIPNTLLRADTGLDVAFSDDDISDKHKAQVNDAVLAALASASATRTSKAS
jgi:transcriptional regulator with XRE-family HTH domain